MVVIISRSVILSEMDSQTISVLWNCPKAMTISKLVSFSIAVYYEDGDSTFHNLCVYFCPVTFFKILEVSWIIFFVVVAAEDQFCRSVFMVMKVLQAWTSKQIREAAKNTPRGGVHKMGGQQLSLKMGEGQPLSWKMVKGQSLSWKMGEWQPPSWEMGGG